MTALEAYALSRKYTKETAIGFGAVKGANCTIADSYEDEDGNKIIDFMWYESVYYLVIRTTDGDTVTDTEVTIEEQEDGSIKYISVADGEEVTLGDNELLTKNRDEVRHTLVTMSSAGSLSEDLKVSVAVGALKEGTEYKKGTSIEKILRDILIAIIPPSITLSISPSKTLMDKETESLPVTTITITPTQKSNPLSKVILTVNNTELKTFTGITSGTPLKFTYTPSGKVNTNTTFSAKVIDLEGLTSTSSVTVSFIYKSYFGCIGAGTEINADSIKTLSSSLYTSSGGKFVASNPNGKFVYAYPSTYANVKKVVNDKGIQYDIGDDADSTSFKLELMNINGITYKVLHHHDDAFIDETFTVS